MFSSNNTKRLETFLSAVFNKNAINIEFYTDILSSTRKFLEAMYNVVKPNEFKAVASYFGLILIDLIFQFIEKDDISNANKITYRMILSNVYTEIIDPLSELLEFGIRFVYLGFGLYQNIFIIISF